MEIIVKVQNGTEKEFRGGDFNSKDLFSALAMAFHAIRCRKAYCEKMADDLIGFDECLSVEYANEVSCLDKSCDCLDNLYHYLKWGTHEVNMERVGN